jgi:hypothetical protein
MLLLVVLPSCIQPKPVSPEMIEAWFNDEDLDNAVFDVGQPLPISTKEEQAQGEVIEAQAFEGFASGVLESQAVLTGTSGFVYYIRKVVTSIAIFYQVVRQNQATGTEVVFLQVKNRFILSVAGTADGTTVLASIKENASNSSDTEVYKLVKTTTTTTTRLTDNTVDEKDVSISGDGFKLVWQGINPGNDRAAIFLRTLNPNGTLLSEGFLANTHPEFGPTVSANGRFIVFVRAVSGVESVQRFEVGTSSTITVVSSSTTQFNDPSVTDDGNKIVYRQSVNIIAMKTMGGANQVLINETNLDHPHITRDGRFLTYTRNIAGIQNVFVRNIATLLEAQISNVGGENDAFESYWQLLPPFEVEVKRTAGTFGGQAFDQLGFAVDLDRDILVVGAPFHDSNSLSNAGAVFIYERNLGGSNNWLLRKKLVATDAAENNHFGSSVAISGDVVVIGAPGSDSNQGAIYIFRRNQGGTDNWGQFRKRVAADGTADDAFGRSVDISGDTIIVGADADDDNGSASGSAYVFRKNQGGSNRWGQVTKLLASDAAAGDHFGTDVAISVDTVVVGAPLDNNAKGIDAGAIYVFQRNAETPETWTQIRKRIANDGLIEDNLGVSVAIDGDIIVAGSKAATNGIEGGAVYVFNRGTNNAWTQVKRLVSSDLANGDNFGAQLHSLAIDGEVLVVGANGDSNGAGASYLFSQNQGGSNNWGEIKKLTASDADSSDTFGQSVAISGETVAVGAPDDDEAALNAGAAYVFE